MGENSKIEWCHHTFNPWVGCERISPACDHCYAAGWARRTGQSRLWEGERRRTTPANWALPLKWDKQAGAEGRRVRVFCASLADVFDNGVDPLWRVDLFRLIEQTPNLDWLLLTKRIGNARTMSQAAMGMIGCIQKPLPPNVWLGATIANQAEADRDIPKLLATPARVRFLSIEPMLGPIDLSVDGLACSPCPYCADRHRDPETNTVECRRCDGLQKSDEWAIDWVIAGAESGGKARPAHPDWFRSLRDQCARARVPFHFKQWGEWREPLAGEIYDTSLGRAAKPPAFIVAPDGTVRCFEKLDGDGAATMIRVGKKAAGRTLDGRVHDEFPPSVGVGS